MEKKKQTIQQYSNIVIFILLMIVCVLIFQIKKISPLEKKVLEEYSDKIVNYIDILESTPDMDKYITFTVKYYYNEKGINGVSIKELQKFILETFNKSYSEDQILEKGLSPFLVNNYINFNIETKTYTYENNLTVSDIAKQKLNKYILEKVKKKNNKSFYVIYTKYTIDNPYKVLDYYETKENNTYDTTNIHNYLKGMGREKYLLDAIDEKNINNFISKKKKYKKIKIEYIVKDEKILISKITTK